MALADYINSNSHLDKFTFDPSTVDNCVKLNDIPVGDYRVKAMFYGKGKNGKAYATIYISNSYFFVPSFMINKVTDMCKDAEVRRAINDGKLICEVYTYTNNYGENNSISFNEA